MSSSSSQPSKPSKISEEAFQVWFHFQHTYHPSSAHIAIGFDWRSLGRSSSSSGRPCINSLLPSSPFRRRRRLLLPRCYHFDLRDYCPIFGCTLHLCARKRRSWPARCSCRLRFPAHPRREITRCRHHIARNHNHECEILVSVLFPAPDTATEEDDGLVVVYLCSPNPHNGHLDLLRLHRLFIL